MRIDCIRLFNIGSYLGEHEIPLYCEDGRNIVLIGGKNGAGKPLCLKPSSYAFMERPHTVTRISQAAIRSAFSA